MTLGRDFSIEVTIRRAGTDEEGVLVAHVVAALGDGYAHVRIVASSQQARQLAIAHRPVSTDHCQGWTRVASRPDPASPEHRAESVPTLEPSGR